MASETDTSASGSRTPFIVALIGLAVSVGSLGTFHAVNARLSSLERSVFSVDRAVTRQVLGTRAALDDYLSTGREDVLARHRRAAEALRAALKEMEDTAAAAEYPATFTREMIESLRASIRDWEISYVRGAIALRKSGTDRDLNRLKGIGERGVALRHSRDIARHLDALQQRIDLLLSSKRQSAASLRKVAVFTGIAGLIIALASSVFFLRAYVSLQKLLRRRSARLENLIDYADRMQRLANADEAARALVVAVGEGARPSRVLLRVPGTPGMRIAAAAGDLPKDAADSPVLGDRSACPVMRTGHRFVIRDPAIEAPCDCQACASRTGGYVCVPLPVQGGTAGLVNWQAPAGQGPGPGNLNRIEEFSRVTSLALTNLFSLEGAMHDAVTDQLTGLANRRFLDGYLGKTFPASMRQGRPLGILMMDLDRFKSFNDTNGHLAGDAVLRAAGRTALAAVREGDLVARYGGEEIVVILPDADRTATLEIAERIRSGIEEMRVDGLPSLRPPVITISIGAAVAPDDGRTAQAAVHAADDALYAAKDSGRNRVRAAGQNPA